MYYIFTEVKSHLFIYIVRCILLEVMKFSVLFGRKCKTHPGPVVHISGNPVDPNKVFVRAYSTCILTMIRQPTNLTATAVHYCTAGDTKINLIVTCNQWSSSPDGDWQQAVETS